MNLIREILEELLSMFVGDARLAVGIAAVVAAAAALAIFTQPWAGGATLLAGCLAVLLDSVLHTARRSRTVR